MICEGTFGTGTSSHTTFHASPRRARRKSRTSSMGPTGVDQCKRSRVVAFQIRERAKPAVGTDPLLNEGLFVHAVVRSLHAGEGTVPIPPLDIDKKIAQGLLWSVGIGAEPGQGR